MGNKLNIKRVAVIETLPLNRNRFAALGMYVDKHMVGNISSVLTQSGYKWNRFYSLDKTVEQMDTIFDQHDYFVFCGGEDIDPAFYEQTPYMEGRTFYPEMDRNQIRLAQLILASDKKAVAICRGQQLFNVAAGGTLIQDLPYDSHVLTTEDPYERFVKHSTSFKKNTFGGWALGQKVDILSAHHQAIDALAKPFHVTALSDDGIIEGIENDKGNVLGVQFHPETTPTFKEQLLPLIGFLQN